MRASPIKIVIVEDDSVFRRGLIRLFENEQCVVSDFANANDALLHIRSDNPDFVVCDYKLPGMSGLELLVEMQKCDSKIPFVLVTAHYSEDLSNEALRSGALAAIPKPLDATGLRGIFEKELGLKN